MTQKQQAGANALGAYFIGRLEGNRGNGNNGNAGGFGRIPSKRALSRYLEYQKGAYGAQLEYLGQHNMMYRGNMMLEHQLGEQAAQAGHVRETARADQMNQHASDRLDQMHAHDTAATDQAHLHATASADQAHLHTTEQAKINSNLNKSQMRTAAKIAPGLREAGVESFEHTADGVNLRFQPPVKAAPAKKTPAKKPSAPTPPSPTP